MTELTLLKFDVLQDARVYPLVPKNGSADLIERSLDVILFHLRWRTPAVGSPCHSHVESHLQLFIVRMVRKWKDQIGQPGQRRS